MSGRIANPFQLFGTNVRSLTSVSLRILIQHLYYRSQGMWHPFRAVVRLSINIDILKAPMCLGGAGLPVDKLKLQGKILACFPKHCKCVLFCLCSADLM